MKQQQEPVRPATNLSALALNPNCSGDRNIMTYEEYLTPWVVVRFLPDMRRVIVGRFRKRSDAEGHLQLLQQQMPNSKFVVMFDSLSS